ncbi:hypothetical protein JBF12_18370 [Streptomyces javensis]|nr:hypothetical protein [Streptomyces javensis]
MSKHTIVDVKGPEGEGQSLTARPATDRPPPLGILARYFERPCDPAPSQSAVTGEGWHLGHTALNRWAKQLAHRTPPAGPRHDAGTAADRAYRCPAHLWGGFS